MFGITIRICSAEWSEIKAHTVKQTSGLALLDEMFWNPGEAKRTVSPPPWEALVEVVQAPSKEAFNFGKLEWESWLFFFYLIQNFVHVTLVVLHASIKLFFDLNIRHCHVLVLCIAASAVYPHFSTHVCVWSSRFCQSINELVPLLSTCVLCLIFITYGFIF